MSKLHYELALNYSNYSIVLSGPLNTLSAVTEALFPNHLLESHHRTSPLAFDRDYISRLCPLVEYFISEMLEICSNCAMDCHQTKAVSFDIHISLHSDIRLLDEFQ